MTPWIWAVVAEASAKVGDSRELDEVELKLHAAAEPLADALEQFVLAHEEDGCCGPGSSSGDYCDECDAALEALEAAGRKHVASEPETSGTPEVAQ